MEFLKYCVKKMLAIVMHVFWIFPVQKNKILFINEHSYNFSDNLKYLSMYLVEKNPEKYDVFFSLKNCDGIEKFPIKWIKIFSIKHFYHALTSSVLITNAGGISYLPLRKKKQIAINTWHGGGPYKVTGIRAIHGRWYEKETAYNAEKVDYILSSCRIFTEEEAKGMYYNPNQIINSGLPKMDIFFLPERELEVRNKIYSEFNIPASTHVILYAPTFRGIFKDYSGVITDEILEIDYERVTEAVKAKFGGDWIFAVRLHPRLKEVMFEKSGIINMTFYPDVEELLLAADMLITDYSSVMWDYSFRDKPCFLFASDLNDYKVKRGFYIPPEHWPFPIAITNDEMLKNINDFQLERYLKKVRTHHEETGSYEKGIACKTVKQLIDKHIDAV